MNKDIFKIDIQSDRSFYLFLGLLAALLFHYSSDIGYLYDDWGQIVKNEKLRGFSTLENFFFSGERNKRIFQNLMNFMQLLKICQETFLKFKMILIKYLL